MTVPVTKDNAWFAKMQAKIVRLEAENTRLRQQPGEFARLLLQLESQEKQRAVKAKVGGDMVYCDACFNRAQGIAAAARLIEHLRDDEANQ